MNETKRPFTVREGLKVQREQMDKLRPRLNPECYAHLEREVSQHNERTDHKTGYDVIRGVDLDRIVSNWSPPQARILTFTDENGETYTTQHPFTGYALSESIARALEHYPMGMGMVVNISIELR